MKHVWLLALSLVVSVPAWGDALSDVRARQSDVARLDGDRAAAEAKRARLADASQKLAAEIDRLKAEPAGVRRDARLQDLLAQEQQTADELQRVAADVRTRAQTVLQARRALMAACDRALAASLPESRRLELARERTAQATLLAQPPPSLGIAKVDTNVASSDLWGPRDLQEKADLLRDSEDKLKREVQRLSLRIDDVERRRHLRERAGAVDDDVFGELSSNRRVARASTSTATAGDRGGATSGTPAAPAPSAGAAGGAGGVAGGGASNSPGSGSGSGATPPSNGPSTGFTGGDTNGHADSTTVLRNLVDPATLDELRRADGSDDLDRQVRALRRAQGELEGLARDLEKRARTLNQRADELKHRK